MHEIWSKLCQGFKDETPLVKSRMRQGEKLSVTQLAPIQQKIEIDSSGSLRYLTCSTEGVFNPQQPSQHLLGSRQIWARQLRHHIQKVGLRKCSNRLSL